MREGAAPQRGRAVRRKPDRLIERARGVVRPCHAQQRVAEPLPAERVLWIHGDRALETRGGLRESLRAKQRVAILHQRIRGSLAHAPGIITDLVLSCAAMSAAVGADVEALCAKCGDVWHVV